MKKKILASVLTLSVTLGILSATGIPSDNFNLTVTAAADSTELIEGNYHYTVNEDDGGAIITKYTGREQNVIIPETLGGRTVTEIADRAFMVCRKLTEVTIPNSIQVIGNSAFYGCTSLTSINIPDDAQLQIIGEDAFSDCTNLTSIDFPKSTQVIGIQAFVKCINLTSIVIPEGTQVIGRAAFCGCEKLENITLPDTLTSIGSVAFAETKALTNITDDQKYIGKYLVGYAFNSNETEITVKEGTIGIADCSVGNDFLTTVHLPEGLKFIGVAAFGGGTGEKSVNFPLTIGAHCCRNLASINIPESVESIGAYAFFGCPLSVSEIKIPDEVTVIEEGTFGNCSPEKVVFGNSVKHIKDNAFYGAIEKSEVLTLPSGIETIGDGAFDGNDFRRVDIPKSVKSIGNQAFPYSLKDVYYDGGEADWNAIDIGEDNEYLNKATKHFKTGGSSTKVEVVVKKPEKVSTGNTYAKTTVNGTETALTISDDGKLDVSALHDGNYTFTFGADNCAPRPYDVTVKDGEAVSGLENGVQLKLWGDVTGDGKIDISDVTSANNCANSVSTLDAYDTAVANVSSDNVKIDISDVTMINNHANNVSSLWK